MLLDNHAGAWILGPDPVSAQRIAESGFHWVAFDLQHGRIDDSRLFELLRATADTVPRWARVRALDAGLIGRALDAGADGVIVPMVEDAEQAAAAARAAHYPPLGARSWGPLSGAYSSPHETPPSQMTCAVMVETRVGLQNVAAIASTPGVDMAFVGPLDLALALGTTAQELLASQDEGRALSQVVEATRAAGIRAGAFGGTPERAALLVELGFDLVAVATDTLLLELGASVVLSPPRT